MKADISLSLFFLSCILAPGLTDSFVKIPLKKTSYTPKTLPEIEAYTADTIGAFKQISQTLDNIVEQRRATICCNDGLVHENEIALALRSAFFNSIIVLNRLQQAITQYQTGDIILDICRACDISPFNPPCNITDWRCPSGKCVPRDKLCDGEDDCEDSSDEVVHNCKDTPCGLDYLCEEDQVCINPSYECDGKQDCSHGSDETHCYLPTDPEACAEDEFQCVTTGRCLPISFHCDFEKDCPDGSDESLCPRPCQADEFRCKSNGVCVPSTFQCDDEADCDDGSDEDDCSPTTPPPTTTTTTTTTTCSVYQFQCASSGNCVPLSWLCDGEKDCEDASDEKDCPTPCHADEFRCKYDGVCVPGTFQCDGKADCDDGSDEADCPPTTPPPTTTTTTTTTTCSEIQFQCVNSGVCVPDSWHCDGEKDCDDASDEEDCPKPTCSENQFQCVNSGVCVPDSWLCDGDKDCDDASDEEDCRRPTCSENQFRCVNSGVCVPDSWLCDGDKDCDDASDEEDCPKPCQADEFRCKSDGVCVPGTYQCDDEVDCDDGSDEDDCVPITPPPTTTTTTSTTVCSSDQFQCVLSGKCVSISWLCDDEEDCSDGSDEANCSLKPSCEEGKIQCPSSGDCIPSHWRCDGYADCKDSSDEENCTVVVKEVCKDSPCSHGCLETPWHVQGFQCTCPDGMTLLAHDRHTCVPRGAKGIKGIKSNIKG